MEERRWKANGVAFKFDKRSSSGADRLTDGQHRCHAIVKSGVTMRSVPLIRIPDPDAILYIDTSGAQRTIADMRAAAGLQHVVGNIQSGLIIEKVVLDPRYKSDGAGTPGFNWAARRDLSRVEQNKCVETYPHLNSIIRANKMSLQKAPVGIVAGMAYSIRHNRKDAVGFFSAALACEEYVSEYEAPQAKQLYLWIEANRPGQHGLGFQGGYRSVEVQVNAAITAFNAWVEGETWNSRNLRAGKKPLATVTKTK